MFNDITGWIPKNELDDVYVGKVCTLVRSIVYIVEVLALPILMLLQRSYVAITVATATWKTDLYSNTLSCDHLFIISVLLSHNNVSCGICCRLAAVQPVYIHVVYTNLLRNDSDNMSQ